MRHGALAALPFLAALTVVAACSSVPDVTFSDTPGVDAGPDVVIDPNCKKTGAEVCDDGVDNDCNGLTDCADPACNAGYFCTDAPPTGWSFVAFSANATPPCPSGFGAQADLKVVTGDGIGGACTCSCSAVGNANCAAGSYALQTGTGTCNITTGSLQTNAAACQALGTPIDFGTGVFASLTAPAGGSYNKATTKGGGVPAITDGRQCAGPAQGGKGCPGTQVCVPKPATMQLCAMKPGAEACPADYSVKRSAGTAATDGRTCNDASCSCTLTPCTGALTLFSNANCMGGQSAVVNSGVACAAATDFGNQGKAKGYTSTVTGGCGVAAGFNSAVTGSVAFTNQETVCCKP